MYILYNKLTIASNSMWFNVNNSVNSVAYSRATLFFQWIAAAVRFINRSEDKYNFYSQISDSIV